MTFLRNAISRIRRCFGGRPAHFRQRGYFVPAYRDPNAPDSYRTLAEFYGGDR